MEKQVSITVTLQFFVLSKYVKECRWHWPFWPIFSLLARYGSLRILLHPLPAANQNLLYLVRFE